MLTFKIRLYNGDKFRVTNISGILRRIHRTQGAKYKRECGKIIELRTRNVRTKYLSFRKDESNNLKIIKMHCSYPGSVVEPRSIHITSKVLQSFVKSRQNQEQFMGDDLSYRDKHQQCILRPKLRNGLNTHKILIYTK